MTAASEALKINKDGKMAKIDIVREFSISKIGDAYITYKNSKLDNFSGFMRPIPLGTDGVDVENFEKEKTKHLINISKRLTNGTYRFHSMREKAISKPAGGYRTLSIGTVRDSIAQQALYNASYDLFEAVMATDGVNYSSFAYRKKFSAPMAAVLIQKYLKQGYVHIIDFDISKYFDCVDHEILIGFIDKITIDDPIINKLLRRFVKCGRVPHEHYEFKTTGMNKFQPIKFKVGKKFVRGSCIYKSRKSKAVARLIGIPQGGKISGMLANIYLHGFDKFVVSGMGESFDIKYVRYADDFLIMAKSEDMREKLTKNAVEYLSTLKLSINSQKTSYYSISEKPIEFVGYSIGLEFIRPSDRNIIRFIDGIKESLIDIEKKYPIPKNPRKLVRRVVSRVNAKVMGYREETCKCCRRSSSGIPKSWLGFFSASTDTGIFRSLDKKIREILYAYLWKKYSIKANRSFLKTCGLLSLEIEYYRIKSIKACCCSENSKHLGKVLSFSGGMFWFNSIKDKRFDTACNHFMLDRKFLKETGRFKSTQKQNSEGQYNPRTLPDLRSRA
ncbi:reverse transcriptase domain-containing protein [Deinococcus sp. PEB2-63]